MKSTIADIAKTRTEYLLLMAFASVVGNVWDMKPGEFEEACAKTLDEYRALPE